MEIRIKHYGKTLYDSECRMHLKKYQLDRCEIEDMWMSFGLGDMDELTDEQVQVRLQEKIDVEINRPERNAFSREEQKVDHYFTVGETGYGTGIEQLPDSTSAMQRDLNDEYDAAYRKLRTLLSAKPEWAEIVIAVVLHGVSFSEYARRNGVHESTVREKYNRAIKKLQKIFPNPTN